MQSRRFVMLAASVGFCTTAALVLPAAAATASQHQTTASGRAKTYLIFLASPAQAHGAHGERALTASEQSLFTRHLALFGVKPLDRYLVPDVVTASMRPAQLASVRLVPGVEAILPNGDIPAPNPDVLTLQRHADAAIGDKALIGKSAPGECGTYASPQLDPEAINAINAEPAILAGDDGAGVKVGFIADGLATANPDFQRNAKFESPGSPSGHPVITNYVDFGGDGTSKVTTGGESFLDASSIAAQGNVIYDLSRDVYPAHPLSRGCDIRIQGDAPGASLTAIKVFSDSFTTNADFVAAINYAVTSGDKVLNESFGSNPFPDDSLDAIKLADDAAVNAGVTVVVSTGDAGFTNTIGSPADDPKVISTGASTTFRAYRQFTYGGINAPGVGSGKVLDDNVSSISSSGFASGGSTVDLVAPGDLNWAVCSANVTKYVDCEGLSLELSGGTSEAAPLTSGAAADVIGAYAATHHGQDPTPALVKDIITSTARDIGAPAYEQGAGLLDVTAAVNLARSIKGSTLRARIGRVLAGTSQLNLSGAPGTTASGTVSLTNTGTSTVALHPYVRALSRVGQATGSVTLQPSTTSHQPKFSVWSGASEVYQTARFSVPAHTDNLSFQAAYGDTNQNSLLNVALFDPHGNYAGYSLPQGLGDIANIEVANPAMGRWTAVFFTEWDGSQAGFYGTSGSVPWDATYWRFGHTGSVSRPTLSIAASATASLTATVKNPLSPGDTAYSLVVGGHMTVPISLRTTVDVSGAGRFTGVVTGGNGRDGAEAQSDVYSFNVPAGKTDLDAALAMSSNAAGTLLLGAQMVGELVDPTGQVQAYDTNYAEDARDGFEVTPYLNLYAARPAPGTWYFLVYWVNPVIGLMDAIPFTGSIEFNQVTDHNDLPDSAATDVSASSGGAFSVTVNNTGVAPLVLTPDARLLTDTTYGLSDVLEGAATQNLPGVADNSYYIPNGTSSVTVDQTSTVRASFDISAYPGDPDLSPLNASVPGVTSTTQTSSTSSLTFTPSTQVTPGIWFDEESEVGPFGAATAPAGTETTTVSIDTLAFDPAVSSPDGDVVQAFTTGSSPINDVGVDPGTSVVIPIDIKPTAALDTTVQGELLIVGISAPGFFVETLSPVELFSNELAAIPYEYTVSP